MNALRLALFTLGCLFALAACAALFGMACSIMEEGPPPSVETIAIGFLVVPVLGVVAFVAFRASRAIQPKRFARQRAALQSTHIAELLCPHCDDFALVQGAPRTSWLFERCHVARCANCGYRAEVSRRDWRRLPLPNGHDPFETPDDRKHAMDRTAMTVGQAIFVTVSVLAFTVSVFFLFDEDETRCNVILGIVFLPVVYGS